MDSNDIEQAVGAATLDDLHLAVSLDQLLAVSVEPRWLALCALRFKSPDTHAMVSPMSLYTSQASLSLLCAALSEGVGADELVGKLFQAAPGERQAQNLLLAYSLYVACFRLLPVADWSENSFSEALEQGNFSDEGFRWFYLLHLGRVALQGVDVDLGRIGKCLPWFNRTEHAKELLESFHAVQSFCKHYPKALLKVAQQEPFQAVLGHLRGIGSLGYLEHGFDSSEGVLRVFG